MMIGVTNTLVSFIVYTLTLLLLSDLNFKYDYNLALILSFVVGVYWSYVFNNKFVFNQKKSSLNSLLKSYFSYFLTGIVFANVISYLSITYLEVGKIVTFFVVIVFTFPLNYILHKFYVFR